MASTTDQLKGSIVGMCNPLLDICADVDGDFLAKYKLKENDAILASEEHSGLFDDMVKSYPVKYIAGGAGQNALRGAQRLLPAGATTFIGCTSNDFYGKELAKAARLDGLDPLYMIDESKPTGTCALLIKGVNRSLVANLAAANSYDVSHLKQPEIWKRIEDAQYFYITGFFVTVSPASILAVAEHTHANHKTFMMNVSAPFTPQFYKDTWEQVLPYVDVLFGNETEAEAWANSFGFEHDPKDVKATALRIANAPKKNPAKPRMVVFTQGSEPTILAVAGHSTIADVKTFAINPVPAKDIVDTNGAGDAFVAGFLSQYVQKRPVERCIECGHWLAAKVICESGASYPETLEAFE
ncbi:adenosine kinase [Dimargaris xerosporica]|nr:adenosine kinase [Dimargaris xerosporica]